MKQTLYILYCIIIGTICFYSIMSVNYNRKNFRYCFFFSIGISTFFMSSLFFMSLIYAKKLPLEFNLKLFVISFIFSTIVMTIILEILKDIENSKNTLSLLGSSLGIAFLWIAFQLHYNNFVFPSHFKSDYFIIFVIYLQSTSTLFLIQRIVQQIRIDQYINKRKIHPLLLFYFSLVSTHIIIGIMLLIIQIHVNLMDPFYLLALIINYNILIISTIAYSEIQYNEKAKKLNFQAFHDELTGLKNRASLKLELKKLSLIKKPFYFLMIDLDNFKHINDYYGHEMGDDVLKITANRLTNITENNGIVLRLGGDEFAVLYKKTENINDYIEKLVKSINVSIVIKNTHLNLSASIGLAMYPKNSHNFAVLMKKADLAMYNAKSNGKNTYCFFSDELIDENG